MAGCSDDSSSSNYYIPPKGHLPETGPLSDPVGADPLKSGVYQKYSVYEGIKDTLMCKVSVNKGNRTMTEYASDGEVGSQDKVCEYTYDVTKNTLTTKTSKLALPKDTGKFLQCWIESDDPFWFEMPDYAGTYTGGYEFAEKTEYVKAMTDILLGYKTHFNDPEYSWGEFYAEQIENMNYEFDVNMSYSYEVSDDGNTVNLTYKNYDDDDEWEDKYKLTFLSAE